MENLKHTKGEWLLNHICPDFVIANVGIHEIVTFENISDEEHEANAKLIAEAGNVANETGKTPRQLADENKELLEALIELMKVIKRKELNLGDLNPIDKAEEAINKATIYGK